MKTKCIVCGKTFETARKDARYCSNACAKKASRSGNTAKKEKELAQIEYQRRCAIEQEEKRRVEEKERREYNKFLKEYLAWEEKENNKLYVRNKLSEIIFNVRANAIEREEMQRKETERIDFRVSQLQYAIDQMLQQDTIPKHYVSFYNAHKDEFDNAVWRYATTHRNLNEFFLPITDDRMNDSIDWVKVTFFWFSFVDVIPYWCWMLWSDFRVISFDVSEWRVRQLIA